MRVWPPISPASVVIAPVRPAASLYAVVKSSCAWAAAESATCIVPLKIGSAACRETGQNSRSPVTVDAQVLVIVEAPSNANVIVDPRPPGAGPGDIGKPGER